MNYFTSSLIFGMTSLLLSCSIFATEKAVNQKIVVPHNVSEIIIKLTERISDPISAENLEELYSLLKSGELDISTPLVYLGVTELLEIIERSFPDELREEVDILFNFLRSIELKRSCLTPCDIELSNRLIRICPPCPPCNPCIPSPCFLAGSFTIDSDGQVLRQIGDDFIPTQRLVCTEDLLGGDRVFEYTITLTRNFSTMIAPIVSTNDESLNARLEGIPTNRSFKIRITLPVDAPTIRRRILFEVTPIT